MVVLMVLDIGRHLRRVPMKDYLDQSNLWLCLWGIILIMGR